MSKVVPLIETIFQNNGGSPELWKATNEVLLTRSDEARHFCAYMKRKVRDMNKDVQLLALDFLDYSIDDGKMPLWTQVSSKDFLTNLVNILKTRDDNDVQNKILYLIEKWGRRFEKYNNIIPNFTSYYKNLKDNGIEFPQNYQSNYKNYIGNLGVNNEYDNSNYNNQNFGNNNLDPADFEKKYKKLVLKLNEMINAMNQVNQFIQNSQNSNYDIGNLRGIISDIKSGEKQLIETIQGDRLKDEKLMEISLHVTEDIKKTLNRYEDLIKGNVSQSFNSNQNNNNQGNFDILEGFGNNNNNQGNNNINQGNNNQGTVNDLLDIFSNPNTNNNPNQNFNSGMNVQFPNNNMNMFNNNMNQNNMMNMGMNQSNNMMNMGMNQSNNIMNMGMNQSNNMMNMGMNQNNMMNMGNMQTQNNQNNFMNQMMGNNNMNNMNLNNQNQNNNNGMNFDFGMDVKQNTNQSNNLFDMGMSNNQNQFNTNTNNNMNFLNMGMNTNTNQNMNNNMFGNNGGNNNNLFNF